MSQRSSDDPVRPDNPAGPFAPIATFQPSVRDSLIDGIAIAPTNLRDAVSGLSEADIETRYKNWTIRQIVHHLADSHVHSYIRFKWTLTENNPTIKAYEEADWVSLGDCKLGAIEPALALLDGLHQKWVQSLQAMSDEQFQRTFFHPQSGESVSLWSALHYYPWHARHHTAQILWLRDHVL